MFTRKALVSSFGRAVALATVAALSLTVFEPSMAQAGTSTPAKGVSAAQVALAWVYAQEERLGVNLAPIPGTKRIKWLEQNVAALDVTLTDDELAVLNPLGDQVAGARY